MFVPFVTPRKFLVRRKGGGGGGHSSSSHGGGTTSHSSSSSSSSSRSGRSSSRIPTSNGPRSATTYGSGGGRVSIISPGQPFSGRSQGGGTRDEVFGGRYYGSGYPGYSSRGVYGRPFPFFFWPVAWGETAGSVRYLGDDDEYGSPSNTSRPGGPMQEATFISSTQNTTFHVLADNYTVVALISAVTANCSSTLSNSSSHQPFPFNDTDPNATKPESAIEYYRASSVVLTLDGYNDTAALLQGDDNSTVLDDTPLPTDIDMKLLTCLNETIGQAVPLIDGASAGPSISLFGLFWMFWILSFWTF